MTTGTWKTSNKKKSGSTQKTKITQFFKPAMKTEVKKIVKREMTKSDKQIKEYVDDTLPLLNNRTYALNLLANIPTGLFSDDRTDKIITLQRLYMNFSLRSTGVSTSPNFIRITLIRTGTELEVGAPLFNLMSDTSALMLQTFRTTGPFKHLAWFNNDHDVKVLQDKVYKQTSTVAGQLNETLITFRHDFKMQRYEYESITTGFGRKYNYYVLLSSSSRGAVGSGVGQDCVNRGLLTFSNN